MTALLPKGRRFPIQREQLMSDESELRLTFSPRVNKASPASFMFTAALTSRSWIALHSGQVQARSSSVIDSLIYPQQEQRFVLGKNWSIFTKDLPAHADLYSSWRTNSPQLASEICLLKILLRTMFFTFNDSAQITWFSLTNLRDNLCKWSCRESEIFA